MSLPGVYLRIRDGALGVTGSSAEGNVAVIGVAENHGPDIRGLSDPNDLGALGEGPLTDFLATHLAISGGVAYAVAIEGTTHPPIAAPSARAGNTGVGALSVRGKQNNAYEIVVEITATGAPTAARFRYIVNGRVASDEHDVPDAPHEYTIPGTGIVLTFSPGTPTGGEKSFVEGDAWTVSTLAPTASVGDVLGAVAAVIDATLPIEGVVLVDMGDSALWASLAVERLRAFNLAQYLFFVTRARRPLPTETTDQWVNALTGSDRGVTTDIGLATVAAWGPMRDTHGGTLTGSMLPVITGMLMRRRVQEPVDAVKYGSLPGVTEGYPSDLNDAHRRALRDAGYITVRGYPGLLGLYVTSGVLMSERGSDYTHLERIRVTNKACRLAYRRLVFYVNDAVTIGADGSPAGVALLQASAQSAIDQMVIDGEISAGEVVIPEGQNLLSTGRIRVMVRIVPLGKMEIIEVEIAYRNPAIEG